MENILGQKFRSHFSLPVQKTGEEYLYFTGNSLGPMPKHTPNFVNEELDLWAKEGVRGHFTGDYPWFSYHESVTNGLAKIVGSKDREVIAMNSLTSNIHFAFASFFRPSGAKKKVMVEASAFPSDIYAVRSFVAHMGGDPNKDVIMLAPKDVKGLFGEDYILSHIEQYKDELCLVFMGGVHYLTGEVMPMEKMAKKCHEHGIKLGLDLAHATGNFPVQLHNWSVDFAVWCHYKYVNGGPGTIGGLFIHEKHVVDKNMPRLSGWWGQNKKTRFEMGRTFDPIPTVEGWQLSNPPILQLAALRGSLEIFNQTSVQDLHEEALKLTEYFLRTMEQDLVGIVESITPTESRDRRGAQLSLRILQGQLNPLEITNILEAKGVICDFRHPDVIRVAFAPLYNTYDEVEKFAAILKSCVR